jgi:hypothetical protein
VPYALLLGDLAVLDGHVAMIVGNGMVIETGCQLGVQNDRRHGIASAHFMCPLEAKLGSQRLFPRAPRTTLNGFCPRYPNCGRDRSRPVRACPGTDAPDGPPTIDAMPLEIHTQPDPDHFCETCGGPSELISQTITPWDGNETMAREVSPWTPRCADPWCQSRRPRHSKMSDTRVCGH